MCALFEDAENGLVPVFIHFCKVFISLLYVMCSLSLHAYQCLASSNRQEKAKVSIHSCYWFCQCLVTFIH